MKIDWLEVVLIIFGLFIAYQLLKAILGGSWQTESLIIAFLVFNLGLTWKLTTKFEGHMSYHRFKENIH